MRIAVLGPLEVLDGDGVPVAVPGAKERLLLAVLTAAAPHVVSTDRIVECLWDGDAPATAVRSLQAHVVRLRSVLEPDRPRGSTGRYVVRRGSGYALAAEREGIDALRFADLTVHGRARLSTGDAAGAARSLSEGLGLWRGEPYGDWPDAPFADAERRRLAEVRITGTTSLLEARLALGQHADVVPEIERLLADDQLQESWWRLLVIALYRCGRQGDALAAAQRARRVLAEELGADPGPELAAVEAAVLAHAPELDPPGRGVTVEPPVSAADAAPCPYKGLATYQASDAAVFHGRRRLVSSLVARLVDTPVVVVAGPSGAGKSSVVRAGLLPSLARDALPGSGGWPAVVVRPGRRPVDALRELTGYAPHDVPVVLVCDQAEELWAPTVDPAERSAFLDTVLGLLDDGIVARCVAVVRGDHLGRFAEHATFGERVAPGLVLVPPLTEPELRDVVRGPADAVGLVVDDELVDAVVVDVHGRPGALPLLSMALVGTWEHRRGNRLTLAGYLEAGGVAGALVRAAESAWDALDVADRDVTHRLLVRLADTGEGGALVRRPLPLAELDLQGELGARRRRVVEAFVAKRLLSLDGDQLDVAHESLLTSWPRLARWLDDDAAGRTIRRHLTPAAGEWERRGRPDDELYRGARLGSALEWAAEHDEDLTATEQRFLEASRRHSERELYQAQEQVGRERRARRRARRLAGGLAVVLVLALVAGALALGFQRAADVRAREAQQASLVADANRLAALPGGVGQVDLSLLLAVQATQLASTPESEDALLAALMTHQRAVEAVVVDSPVQDSALAGDGTLFMDTGRSVYRLSLTEGDPRVPMRVGSWGRWLVADASPTGGQLVAAGRDVYEHTWVRLLDADGVTVDLLEADEAVGPPLGVSFSADGRSVRLLVGGDTADGGAVRSWRLTEFDVASRGLRGPGASGSLPGVGGAPEADVSADGSSAVVFDRGVPPDVHAALVDLTDGREVPIDVAERPVDSTGFRALASGAVQMWDDGAVTLYGPDGRQRDLLVAGREPVEDAVLSPDGTWAATVGGGGVVTLWDVDPATARWELRESFIGHGGDVRTAEVTSDGRRLVTIGADGRVVVWDATVDGGFGAVLGGGGGRQIAGRPDVVEPGRVVVAPTVAPVEGGEPGTLDVAATFLDPRTGTVIEDVVVGHVDGSRPEVPSLAVSPNRRLIAVTDGQTTTVLDAVTRKPVRPITLPPRGDVGADGAPLPAAFISCLGWTPDSSRLVLCTRAESASQPTGALVAVDPTTGERDAQVDARFSGLADSLVLSPDDRWLTMADLIAGQVVSVNTRDLTVGGLFLAAEGTGKADLSYSSDGRLLAVVTRSGHLFVVDTTTTTPTPSVPLGRPLVQALWLSDDRTVAASASDGTVFLFDTARGQLRAPPISAAPGGSSPVYLLPVSHHDVLAISGVHPARRWSLDPDLWVRQACAVAGRNLTRSEWTRYLPQLPYQRTCTDVG
jgi:DNA-binding SARP family transcriptional activator/WD40 repeat protein